MRMKASQPVSPFLRPLCIGSLRLANPLILAPLAGINNLPFRLMVKQAGCGLVCSEMISSNGLVHRSIKTLRMLASDTAEKPLSIQIFGASPAIMAEAAQMVEAAGADLLDINFGCSVRKIVKSGSGVALMRDARLTEKILTEVRKTIRIPLTIKIRSGWDVSGAQAMQIARIAEGCGVDALAVHPRTARQGFGGRADWALIKKIKEAVALPVIGNGDVQTPTDALTMLSTTGCDGVMIGRAAIGNPWLFRQILDTFMGLPPQDVCVDERFSVMRAYLEASVDYLGELHACRMMRSRLAWFVKGLPNASRFRDSLKTIETHAQAVALIDRYASALQIEKGGTAASLPIAAQIQRSQGGV
jgi:nifR3 family TIM-barrel protein